MAYNKINEKEQIQLIRLFLKKRNLISRILYFIKVEENMSYKFINKDKLSNVNNEFVSSESERLQNWFKSRYEELGSPFNEISFMEASKIIKKEISRVNPNYILILFNQNYFEELKNVFINKEKKGKFIENLFNCNVVLENKEEEKLINTIIKRALIQTLNNHLKNEIKRVVSFDNFKKVSETYNREKI
ncbi:MAG: hypothetical protein IJZ29_04930 [Clostridia bacterium]|nr:hypothetical protein [Clostridia bacterium]